MKKTLIFSLLWLLFAFANAQTTWVIDPVHSTVQFEVSHLSISSVTGLFTSYSGTVTSNGEDFRNASANITIDASSITTNNLERDRHLKEDDFFNVKKYPKINFVSKKFSLTEDNNYIIEGDLTIREKTMPIILTAEFGGIISINKIKKAGFKAKGKINRFEYGLKWDDLLDSGGLMVGEEVDLILNVELVKQ